MRYAFAVSDARDSSTGWGTPMVVRLGRLRVRVCACKKIAFETAKPSGVNPSRKDPYPGEGDARRP